jgi:hypothetical protein
VTTQGILTKFMLGVTFKGSELAASDAIGDKSPQLNRDVNDSSFLK